MPNPGDSVKIYTKEETYEGTLMPRPELLNQGFVVLKLKNGYNMGIEKSKIKKIELVKKYSQPTSKTSKVKQNKNLPTISILSCGGTISSKIDYRTGGVYADYTADDFLTMEPRLQEYANIKAKKIMAKMSEDYLAEDWIEMAKSVEKELKTSDAVILTQGTDTLHYSTAALSFFLRNLNKPVIFTAAQRSIDRGSSDAFMNLLCAVKAGAFFDGAGVFLVMHGSSSDDYCYIHKGTKVRKMHSLRRDAFRSINDFPLAKIYPVNNEIEILNNNYTKKQDVNGSVKLDANFEENVALVYVYPGMEPKILDFYMDNNYKGIVLAATALGHVPTSSNRNLMKQLERAEKDNVPIVVATQCLYGRVDPLVYGNLRRLSTKKNVIFVDDMLPEVAYVKLGWVLSKTKKLDEIKAEMKCDIAGEINYTHDPRCFLN
jgi:glutamyl-tRNA(Gln) amidotransferase subunit D